VQGLSNPISSAAYPRMNALLAERSPKALRLLAMLVVGQGLFTLVLSGTMFFASPNLTPLVLGQKFVEATPMVQWLAPIPLIAGLSNVLGINMMLPLGMNKHFTMVTLAAGLINIAMIVPLSRAWGGVGAAASVTMTEVFVTVAMAAVMFARRHRLYAAVDLAPAA
jgi:O-antigen/teichoic acid export membrane protein